MRKELSAGNTRLKSSMVGYSHCPESRVDVFSFSSDIGLSSRRIVMRDQNSISRITGYLRATQEVATLEEEQEERARKIGRRTKELSDLWDSFHDEEKAVI